MNTFFLATIAWCGGMTLQSALVNWRDDKPWKVDAAYAIAALLTLIL